MAVPYKIAIPKKGQLFGFKYSYCRWEISNSNDAVELEFNSFARLNTDKLIVEVFNEEGTELLFLNDIKHIQTFKSPKKFTVHHWSELETEVLPFTIDFISVNSDNFGLSWVFLLIILIILLLVAGAIVYFCRTKRTVVEKEETQATTQNTKNLSSKEIEKVEFISKFKQMYKVRNYTEEVGVDSTNCLICFDVMKAMDKVVKLNCTHQFHGKCVTDFFKNKIYDPVCPTCNLNIFQKKELKEKKEEIKEGATKRRRSGMISMASDILEIGE